MTAPWYVALLVAHVLSAVVGFGALAMTGLFASRVRRLADPRTDEAVRRYFRPGRNVASLAIVAVPLLGAAMLATGARADVRHAYPWIGVACWLAAAGVASGLVWPAERALQQALARPTLEGDLARLSLDAIARRCSRGAAITSVLFVVALVAMVAQP